MNKISKERLALAKKNLRKFKSKKLLAALVTGSVAKGYADDYSDIDTLLIYKKVPSKKEFEQIVKEAEESGGGLYHGTPEDGFAVYYYIEGVKCDFGIGHYSLTEKLINGMLIEPELDPIKHLQISGILESVVLYGNRWMSIWKKKARRFPKELGPIMVKQNLKFHPRWVIEKMAVARGDVLFYNESFMDCISAMVGILCGLNKIYLPGKLKGIDATLGHMKIKPANFLKRYRKAFGLKGIKAVNELFKLIDETIALVDKHMPEVSTERAKEVRNMVLRK